MKWIGQNIYDQISRFRDHTFFEDSITLSTGKSITMDEYTSGTISITKVQDSGTTFNDNDTSLMTAAAIADKIEAYDYITTAGDINSVVAGVGLSGGATSGDATLTVDFSEFSTVTPTSGDFLATLDSDGATEQKTTTDALATLFAGSGLTASSGVIGVDTLNQSTTGQAGTVATIAGLAPNTATTQATQAAITTCANLTTVGTVAAGAWRGDVIASVYLDADTAHLSGTQSFTGTKTFDETISGAIDGNAATATALATARTIGGTSFDGTGNIAVAAATNLTASTSTAVGLGTIELGHATDTTIARSAAGVVTIEGNKIETRKTLLHLQQTSFSRDIQTTEFFIPLNTTAESTSITNVNVPMVMPVAGKLLKIHFKVNQHHNGSSNTMTFKLYDVDDGETWSTGNSNVLGTKVINGPAREDIGEADFTDLTTSGASGTNAFAAGDLIGITVTNSVDLATTNYLFTFVFELDFNSY